VIGGARHRTPRHPLVVRCYALRRTPVGELTTEEMRLLLGQDVGVRCILPRVVEVLEADLMVAGDLFPGDILLAALRARDEHWATRPTLRATMEELLRSAVPPVAERAPPGAIRRDLATAVRRFLGETGGTT
jgi:hypothetical protein